MQKSHYLKKKLIRESAIAGGALALLTALMLVTGGKTDAMRAQSNDLQNTVTGYTGQVGEFERKYALAKTSLDRYLQLAGDLKRNRFSVFDNEKEVKEALDTLRKRYWISNPDFGSQDETPHTFTSEPYVRTAAEAIYRNANLRFNAVADTYAFGFLESMTKTFPGFLIITSLKVSRGGDLSKETLTRLHAGEDMAVVTAEATFKWFGIRMKPKENAVPAVSTAPIGELP